MAANWPTCTMRARLIFSLLCRARAWATSCPTTAASSASVSAMSSRPVYTATLPPGRQKAFTASFSMVWNSQRYWGRSATAAMRRPTRSTRADSGVPVTSFSFFSTCCMAARPILTSSASEYMISWLRPV